MNNARLFSISISKFFFWEVIEEASAKFESESSCDTETSDVALFSSAKDKEAETSSEIISISSIIISNSARIISNSARIDSARINSARINSARIISNSQFNTTITF